MAETFDSIRVVTQDGLHELDVANVPRAQRLENFKSRVAVELTRSERRYINHGDLELFLFSERMEDTDRTLADYGLKDGAIITRIDHFHSTKPRAVSIQNMNLPNSTTTNTAAATTTDEPNLPPYPGPPGKTLDNLFVKLDHRTINLHGLSTTSTIQDLYDKLKQETKLSQANTGLIFGCKELKPSHTLRDVDIGNNSTIFVFDKLPGGSC